MNSFQIQVALNKILNRILSIHIEINFILNLALESNFSSFYHKNVKII